MAVWLNCACNHLLKCQPADTRNGSVFTALATHHQTVTWSAHLAVSQAQDPFILESKQLPLIYSLMPRGSIEVPCVHSGPGWCRRAVGRSSLSPALGASRSRVQRC